MKFLASQFNESEGQVSPNGCWMADDGERFLVNIAADETPGILNVITNWENAAAERRP